MIAARRQEAGVVLYDEPMAGHVSWRAGGCAARFYRPRDLADLREFLRAQPAEEPLLWLGLGSNLLVRSGGFAGTVIALAGVLDEIAPLGGGRLRVEAGVACARVARSAAQAGLTGVEFLAGIPGTMGGALAMNAGAFGGETWTRVAEVETIDRRGDLRRRGPGEFKAGYRRVDGPPGEYFVAATLQLEEGRADEGIKALLERRAATQPIGLPSCGSVFRNPPGDHAGRLIEAAGLKGSRIGGAEVSEKHANFIVNTGGASADDIEALIELVQERVEHASGVRLETEVKIVGVRAGHG